MYFHETWSRQNNSTGNTTVEMNESESDAFFVGARAFRYIVTFYTIMKRNLIVTGSTWIYKKCYH